MRDGGIGDERLVGRVEEDDGVVGQSVVDPPLQLLLGRHGAGRVVREAEVDHVHLLLRICREEAVFFGAGHVDQPLVVPLVVCIAGAADHDVGVVIDRVDRVADSDGVIHGEDVEDVGAVTLGAVGDEHLRGLQVDAQRLVGFLDDGVDQEVVPLLRAVTHEGVLAGEVVHRVVERFENSRGKRLGHVTDPQADHLRFRICGGEGAHAAPDLGEKVSCFKFQVVVVNFCHIFLQKVFLSISVPARPACRRRPALPLPPIWRRAPNPWRTCPGCGRGG